MNDKEMYSVAQAERGVIQCEEELLWALDEMRRHFGLYQPRVVLEIGSASGGALCMWSQLLHIHDAPHESQLIAISPGANVQKNADAVRTITDKPLEWIDGYSESADTMDVLLRILDGRKIDVVFVDSLHTYEQSAKELDLYMPLVNKPGVFAFHDIVQDGLAPGLGEPCTGDFWHEIKYNYDYVEKHDKNSGINFGIGMILL